MPKNILQAIEQIIEDCQEIRKVLSPTELVKELYAEDLKKPECLMTEEELAATNAELAFDDEQDKKLEEGIINEEE